MLHLLKGHGRRVSKNPKLVISLSVIITLITLPGLLKIDIITNPERVWVPTNSKISLQKKFFDNSFTPFFRINQAIFTSSDEDVDLIQVPYIQKLMEVQRKIIEFSFQTDSKNISLNDLCFKPIEGQSCLVESPAQYWLSDPVILHTDPTPPLTVTCQTSHSVLKQKLPCFDQIGTPVMRHVVLGGISPNSKVVSPDPCGDFVPSAKSLFLTFLLNNFKDQSFQENAVLWEKLAFINSIKDANNLLKNDIQTPMKVSYMAGRSIEDSLSTEAKQNAWIVAVSYLAMFIYIALALGKPFHPVRSRYKLALMGIIIVASSFLCSISILSVLGLSTTLIVWEVVPFLTLAIGVDNMFIITREFDRLESIDEFNDESNYDENGAGLNIGIALCNKGPSVLAAGMCEVIIFAIGALTDIPALRQFGIVASTAVFVNLLFQMTWFIASLSLDAQRVRKNLPEFCFRKPKMSRIQPNSDGNFIDRYYLPFLYSNIGQTIALLVTLGLLISGIFGLNNMKLGLEPQLAAPDKSHLQNYYDDLFKFGEAGPPAYLVLSDLDYFGFITSQKQNEVLSNLLTKVAQVSEFVDPPLYSWLDSMQSWVDQRDSLLDICPGQKDIVDSESFVEMLQLFLSISITSQCCQSHGICGAQFKTDVVIQNNEVKASRIRFNLKPLNTQESFISSLWQLQTVVEKVTGKSDSFGMTQPFVYSIYMVYYEQYLYIRAVALQGLLLAVGVVFTVVLVLSDLVTASLMSVMEIMMAVSVVGMAWLWGLLDFSNPYTISINAVSVCNLVMAVGLSVEFFLHILHAFKESDCGTKKKRAWACMKDTGASIFLGITLTKLVGVMVLSIAPSHLFRLYYFRMYVCIVLVGGFLGLAVLPLILAKVGPAFKKRIKILEGSNINEMVLSEKLLSRDGEETR